MARRASFAVVAAAHGLVEVDFSEAQSQPEWSRSVSPGSISEDGGMPTVTVDITNSVTLDTGQTIALSFGGTAATAGFQVTDAGDSVLTAPHQLALPTGQRSVTAKVKPVNDTVYEAEKRSWLPRRWTALQQVPRRP